MHRVDQRRARMAKQQVNMIWHHAPSVEIVIAFVTEQDRVGDDFGHVTSEDVTSVARIQSELNLISNFVRSEARESQAGDQFGRNGIRRSECHEVQGIFKLPMRKTSAASYGQGHRMRLLGRSSRAPGET